MEKLTFERLCMIDEDYTELGQEKLADLIEQGKELVEKHGEENLQYKLETEEEMIAVGAYLDWRIATNDENYEPIDELDEEDTENESDQDRE